MASYPVGEREVILEMGPTRMCELSMEEKLKVKPSYIQ